MKCKLSDVSTIKYGKDHKHLIDGKIPVYGSGGVMRYANTALYNKESVLIPRKGSLGNLFFVDKPFWTVDTLFYTEIDETKIIPKYFYYYLKTLDLAKMNVGTAVPSLTTAVLNEIQIDLPPLSEQKIIADTLSALDDKIENNNKINHNLEQMAQAIFKSWFIDFEPFGGVMPSDWRVGTLGEITDITSGKRPPLREAFPTSTASIPLVGASSVMGFTSVPLYSEKILITGRVGTHGIIQRFSNSCWASDNTLVIKSKYYEFAYQQLRSIDFHNMNRGSTQPLITQTDLKNVPIVVPTEEILCDFERLQSTVMTKYESNLVENEHLAELRDTLLPRLMSGELSVADSK